MRIASTILVCAMLAGCGWFTPEKYAAEVGYYQGDQVAWELWGDFSSLDECRDAAIAQYNAYVARDKQAYSWSCLLKDGNGGYVSRHR